MSKYHLQTREKVSEEQQRVFEQQRQELVCNCELLEELKKQNLETCETELGVVVNPPDVLLTFGEANLTPGAHARVEDIAKILSEQAKARRVSVEGHTDSIGSEAFTQRLHVVSAQRLLIRRKWQALAPFSLALSC
jgi:outer membrane protein OmpA-like peptidoglycan-associated protein